jgi:hypothetical protein
LTWERYLLVTTGLDPVVHAEFDAAWIAGSSPAMTILVANHRSAAALTKNPRGKTF